MKYRQIDQRNDLTLYKEMVELTMQFLEKNNFDIETRKLTFHEVSTTCTSNMNIYLWLRRQLSNDLDTFYIECLAYQSVYPKAYQKIFCMVEKKKTALSRQQKIEIMMKHIETHEIPPGNSPIRFCDIDVNTKNTNLVGIFIQTKLQYYETKFIEECTKYQEKYPQAYLKIATKINRRHSPSLITEEKRLIYFMKYIETYDVPIVGKKIRFCDLDLNDEIVDTILVDSWFNNLLSNSIEWLEEECKKFQNNYPKASQKIMVRIENRRRSSRKESLSFEERIAVIMCYLEKNDFATLGRNISFSDITSNKIDQIGVDSWICRQLFLNLELFFHTCAKYQDQYPRAYQQMLNRKVEFFKRKKQNRLSFQEKVFCFMAYIETLDTSTIEKNLRFCDITPNCMDESNVGCWILTSMSKKLPELVAVYSNYQAVYPKAYQKLNNMINASKVRLQKERRLLIEELIQRRNYLLEEEQHHTIRRVRMNRK